MGSCSSSIDQRANIIHSNLNTLPNHVQNSENRPSTPPENRTNKFRFKFDQRVLQKYHIEALIGQGSFSKVVRARHRLTKVEYAVKIVSKPENEKSLTSNSQNAHDGVQNHAQNNSSTISKDLIREGSSEKLCETELRVLRRVRHRNIIQLVEVFESGIPNQRVYLVMEMCKGGELFDRIVEHGPMLELPGARAVSQILDGVRYLHNLAIVHRDLKLENILYCHSDPNNKRLVITDFGLAKINARPGDRMHTTCGTPEYIAPELLKRIPYTKAVDSWAVGVVSFAVLAGMMPFEDDDRIELYRKILHGRMAWDEDAWQGISGRARDFVKKLITVDENLRMSAAEASRHPFIQAVKEYDQQMESGVKNQNSQKERRAGSRHSDHSGKTDKSQRSLRSQHRRVREDELDQLLQKYETQIDK